MEAVANLATASSADKETITTLINTNATLVKEVESLRQELAGLRKG